MVESLDPGSNSRYSPPQPTSASYPPPGPAPASAAHHSNLPTILHPTLAASLHKHLLVRAPRAAEIPSYGASIATDEDNRNNEVNMEVDMDMDIDIPIDIENFDLTHLLHKHLLKNKRVAKRRVLERAYAGGGGRGRSVRWGDIDVHAGGVVGKDTDQWMEKQRTEEEEVVVVEVEQDVQRQKGKGDGEEKCTERDIDKGTANKQARQKQKPRDKWDQTKKAEPLSAGLHPGARPRRQERQVKARSRDIDLERNRGVDGDGLECRRVAAAAPPSPPGNIIPQMDLRPPQLSERERNSERGQDPELDPERDREDPAWEDIPIPFSPSTDTPVDLFPLLPRLLTPNTSTSTVLAANGKVHKGGRTISFSRERAERGRTAEVEAEAESEVEEARDGKSMFTFYFFLFLRAVLP